MSTTNVWSGRKVQQARAIMAQRFINGPVQCWLCSDTVNSSEEWVVEHKEPIALRPDLMLAIDNWAISHRKCSDASGSGVSRQKRVFPQMNTPGSPRPSLETHTEPQMNRSDLIWDSDALSAHEWLRPLLTVPDDASVPLAMSPPKAGTTGSYGWDAVEWMETELGITLRWWQRLAVVRQLEHDEAGRLTHRIILESCPRRAGKSVRLRAMALWRIAHADLFGERQLCLHTGKDVAIVREIHRQAWSWASERDDWNVRKGVGQEEVTTGDNRWLVRSLDSTYGYDLNLGCLDEAWACPTTVLDEALEPATLERVSPQILLTSTAHRRATPLMPKRLAAALSADDEETLLLLWAAPQGADPGDPEVWRAASPHWTDDRRKLITSKYEKALQGEQDQELDDADPMKGFTSQYLNVWQLNARKHIAGNTITDEETWAALATRAPATPAQAAAIESWFEDGCSLALAWSDGTVHVKTYPDLASAAAAAPPGVPLIIGASLINDPAFKHRRLTKGAGRGTAAVLDMSRALTEGTLQHTGQKEFTEQVLAVRSQPSPDGIRLVSKQRTDGIKAAMWAHNKARAPGVGKIRIITVD